MKGLIKYLLFIFLLLSCSKKTDTIPVIDLKKIYLSKLKIYYDSMKYYDFWGIININKGEFINEDNINDIKIFNNHIFIQCTNNKIYQYNAENGSMIKEFNTNSNSPLLSFDIDTTNMNIALLDADKLIIYDKNSSLVKNINLDKHNYTTCQYIDNNKVILISNHVPEIVYSTIDIKDNIITTIDSNKKNELKLNTKSHCIGKDSNILIYKNILNDTIYKFINNKFEPYIKGDIGKYKIIYKGEKQLNKNAIFRILNLWHINDYWFIQYNYSFKFKGKNINYTGLAIYDNKFNMLESDVDSYINGQCLYLDSTLDMFVNKENNTFYQVYKNKKSKWYNCDKKNPDSICINYFKVK